MPEGYSSKLQIIVIKDYYSKKLYIYSLQSKTLTKILHLIKNFQSLVYTRYKLKIYKILQDNNTATLSQRGILQYKTQINNKSIKIKYTLLYTYKLNSRLERASQEVITKSIKIRSSANLLAKLWPKVIEAAVQLYNISLSTTNKLCSPNKQLNLQFTQYLCQY